MGRTVFDYLPAEDVPEPQQTTQPVPTSHDEALQTTNQHVDHWIKQGTTWTRHHKARSDRLYEPTFTPDGPDITKLNDERVTTVRDIDGETTTINDNWRDPQQTNKTLKRTWTGTTVFTEKAHYPQLLLDDYVDEALLPNTLNTPNEPTPQQR